MPINITMPALSPTMTEGTLARWLKSEGDTVESGDVIAEIETDKATMEIEAVDEGIIGKIFVSEGTENVPINEVIAVLLEEGESAFDIENTSPVVPAIVSAPTEEVSKEVEKSDPPKTSPAVRKLLADNNLNASQISASGKDGRISKKDIVDYLVSSASNLSLSASKGDRVFASPLAKSMAKEADLDISNIAGSGPSGRVVKTDVEKAKAAPKPIAAAPTETVSESSDIKVNMFGMAYTEIPNNNVRKIVAKRLTQSKQEVPHFYLTVECILDSLLNSRKEINDKANGAFKISVNDFIIKAAAMALKIYPAANVSWSDDAVHQYLKSDISVAVSTPTGLITPIVKAAEDKGLSVISTEMKDLAAKAREGKLAPDEFQGGSFTISNLGMFGVKEFSPIINLPQGCILAIGAGEQRPVVINGEIKIKTVMNCTLSVDHRCVDGAVGAEYLQIFKQYIENPVSMLV